MFDRILGVFSQLFALIGRWLDRNPKVQVDPKIKAALDIRQQISEQTNQTLILMQQRKLDELRIEITNLDNRVDSILDQLRKANPPVK